MSTRTKVRLWVGFWLVLGGGLALAVTVYGQETAVWKERRVESVTWDPVEHKLRWVVSRGVVRADGRYAPQALDRDYEIDFNRAEMKHRGVTRGFSEEEAQRVLVLMKAVSRYAAESVEWWEKQGRDLARNPLERGRNAGMLAGDSEERKR